MCWAHWELSFHVFFMPWQSPQPECWASTQMMSFQSLAPMIIIMAIAALSALALVGMCSWMQCFMFAGSRSAPHQGKRPQCAATPQKMALISAILDDWSIIAPNLKTMMVHSFGWLMSSHLMMLTMQREQTFNAFTGRSMWSSDWPNIIAHHVMSNLQEQKNKYEY